MTKRLTFEQFVEEANKVHNFLYIYPKQVYKNNGTDLEIICLVHRFILAKANKPCS